MKWCDYITNYAGQCGLPATHGNRCKKHQNKPQKPKNQKIEPYSGDSKYRAEIGQFQAKNGR